MIPKTARLITWEGRLPESGEYMRTFAGSVYLIIGVKLNKRPEPKSLAKLDLLKFTEEEKKDIPSDAIFHEFHWNSRKA